MNTISEGIGEWLRRSFLLDKLNNGLGWTFGVGFALFMAALFALLPLKFAMLFIVAMIGIPLLGACFTNVNIGIGFILTLGFFVEFLRRYTNAPFGIGLDALLFILSFSMLVQVARTRDLSFAKHPISTWTLIWMYFCLAQVLNPWAESKLAWIFTVRSLAGLLFLYFIACFAMKNLKTIKILFKIILVLSMVAALYALKQELIGFSNNEIVWLNADPKRYQLIVQWNRMRVFSLFSNPTTFGILMAYMSVFCLVLAMGPYSWIRRTILIISALLMMLGMAYAGSRTPFVLVPIGVFFYTILTLNRVVIGLSGVFAIGLIALILGPSSNPVVYRIQSAFKPGEDASMQVRIDNQRLIQPWIWEHPVGSGLGSTGEWAQRFTPHHWLAGFAHDSGYVRIAVEGGWIGLIIYMFMLFVIMRWAIFYYLRVKDPFIKNLYCAITVTMLILVVANYPQEAIVMLPTSLIFYIFLAAIVRLKDFDESFALKTIEQENPTQLH